MFTFVIIICLLFRNGLSGAARGAKSIVNRMGRGISGIGRAGVDSVARNENRNADFFSQFFIPFSYIFSDYWLI